MRLKVFVLLSVLSAASACAEVPWRLFHGGLRTVDAQVRAIDAQRDGLPGFPRLQIHERAGFHSGFAPTEDSLRWVQVDLGMEYDLDLVVLVPAVLGGADAYGFPRGFRVDASTDPLFAASIPLSEHAQEEAVLMPAPWCVSGRGVRARYVRVSATRLVAQEGNRSWFFFCLGELLVFSGGRNVALRSAVEAPRSVETLPTWSPRHLVDGTHPLGLPVAEDSVRTNGWHSAISSAPEIARWVQVDLGLPLPIDEVRIVPAHPADYPDRPGFGFPRRFKVEADGKMVVDCTEEDFPAPGDTAVAFPTPGLLAQTIRITATRLWERSGDFVFAAGELQVFSSGTQVASGARVTAADSTRTGLWKPEFLVDGCTSSGRLVSEREWLLKLSQRRVLLGERDLLVERRRALEAVAQERAVWAACGIGVGVVGIAGFLGVRSRRSRRREMEGLRERISRDLHDEIGSQLGSIRLMSELALREKGGDVESLREIRRMAGEAAESMRGIVWLVREGEVPVLSSLVEAVRNSAGALLKGVAWTVDSSDLDAGIQAPLAFHRNVFLFFREAAHNVVRHATATRVHIRIAGRQNRFMLSVTDDGRGFDLSAVREGHGMANLRHRAASLGGKVRIVASPGRGTDITLEVPLE